MFDCSSLSCAPASHPTEMTRLGRFSHRRAARTTDTSRFRSRKRRSRARRGSAAAAPAVALQVMVLCSLSTPRRRRGWPRTGGTAAGRLAPLAAAAAAAAPLHHRPRGGPAVRADGQPDTFLSDDACIAPLVVCRRDTCRRCIGVARWAPPLLWWVQRTRTRPVLFPPRPPPPFLSRQRSSSPRASNVPPYPPRESGYPRVDGHGAGRAAPVPVAAGRVE